MRMLFSVALAFSGNATVKAIDKLLLFKQGIKRMHDLKSTPGVGKGFFADCRSSLTSAPLR